MTTTFHSYGETGSFYYRTHLPACGLGAGYVQGSTLGNHEGMRGAFNAVMRSREPIEGDTVVTHMPFRDWQLEQIKDWKAEGRRVIVDVDDWLPNVPRDNPGYKRIMAQSGVWFEGIGLADAITVSVPTIKRMLELNSVWKSPHPPITVIRNGIDPWRYDGIPSPRKDKSRFVIGWEGAHSQGDVWERIRDDVCAFLRDHPDAILSIVGHPPAGLDSCEEPWKSVWSQIQFQGWCGFHEYPAIVKTFDIGLAPSGSNLFWECKSQLRLLEYGCAALPIIADGITYVDHLKHGKTGLLADESGGWYVAIKDLYESRKLRHSLGQAWQRTVKAQHTITNRLAGWQAVLGT